MVDPAAGSEQYTVISFYGVRGETGAARGFYDVAVDWFLSLGRTPDIVKVRAPGYSDKPIAFARAHSRIEGSGFAGVTSLFIVTMSLGGVIPVNDYALAAQWSSADSYALISSRSDLAHLSRDSILPVAEGLIDHLLPEYGIGYSRRHELGPAMYAVGVNQGHRDLTDKAEEEAALAVSRWGYRGMPERVWKEGLIRDVHRWNFLTRPQLDRRVGNARLQSWIHQDDKRGRLFQLARGVTLWEVDEENVAMIRQQLSRANVIFDWRD